MPDFQDDDRNGLDDRLMSKNPRYDGQLFLRLLECYVLSCIGELSEEHKQKLEEIAPKLGDVFGVAGDWRQVIRQVMEMSTEMDTAIEDLWKRNVAAATDRGEKLDPEHFARTVVDTNFRDS